MGIHQVLRALGAYTIPEEDIQAYEDANRGRSDTDETGLAQQEVVKRFIENLDAIGRLSETQRLFALAKLVEKNPGLLDQVKRIKTQLSELRLAEGWAGVQGSAGEAVGAAVGSGEGPRG